MFDRPVLSVVLGLPIFASPRSHQLVQAYWRGYTCRKLLKEGWLKQLQACLASSCAVDILAAGNPVLPLFHRVFRADSPADLPILNKISTDFTASILRKGRLATDVDRAIFYTVRVCSAILRTIEAQRYSNTVTMSHGSEPCRNVGNARNKMCPC